MIRKTAVILLSAAVFLTGCGSDSSTYYTLEEVNENTAADAAEDAADVPQETAGTDEPQVAAGTDKTESSGQVPENIGNVVVYVCGEVNSPGVYTLPSGSRIADAFEAAGGITENGDDEIINRAELLTDGEKIRVPGKDETADPAGTAPDTGDAGTGGEVPGGTASGDTGSGKVDINTATKEELMSLSGIGEAKAEAVIQYREENGGFSRPEDIKKVSGIGDSTYNSIKEDIISGQENR